MGRWRHIEWAGLKRAGLKGAGFKGVRWGEEVLGSPGGDIGVQRGSLRGGARGLEWAGLATPMGGAGGRGRRR